MIAILNILQDYEVPDEVLHQQLFGELKYSVPLIMITKTYLKWKI